MHRRPQSRAVSDGQYSSKSRTDDCALNGGDEDQSSKVRAKRTRKKRIKNEEDDPMVYILKGLAVIIVILIVVMLGIVAKLFHLKMWPSVKEYFLNPVQVPTPPQHNKEPLLESLLYNIPHSMSHIGDKSDEYALLRKDFDARLTYDPERSVAFVKNFRKPDVEPFENPLSYNVYNCPKKPPEGYPYQWKTFDVITDWKPNDVNPPSQIHQGICVFDYRKDYVKALNYRKAEVPFVVRGDPEVAQTIERWHTDDYISKLLGDAKHRCEYSETNQFMYWINRNKDKPPPGWKKPTKMLRITFDEWLKNANITDASKLAPDQPHYYFRLIGCGEIDPHGGCDDASSEFLFDELTFFQPRTSLYMVEPEKQRGIHCRFGMTGVTAENHFDGSRNMIVVLGGRRRYVLTHPQDCENLYLYPKGHPSARHSQIDWNNPDLDEYPLFQTARSNEVILQAGDVLYLPQHWFHFIVSLDLNFQCNTRSGKFRGYDEPIRECGF
ncbi:unnamed protein product [Cylindrotheca closterium]|uniref:JmjC domain-containing protein n=1 Tax=Cylindrotheca closterium TaxID=2856 RepID=A0AAD2G3V7_9STRA|nr:unnamed protein product [Cylindrotheca closterium]